MGPKTLHFKQASKQCCCSRSNGNSLKGPSTEGTVEEGVTNYLRRNERLTEIQCYTITHYARIEQKRENVGHFQTETHGLAGREVCELVTTTTLNTNAECSRTLAGAHTHL